MTKHYEQPKCSDKAKWDNKVVGQSYYGIFLAFKRMKSPIHTNMKRQIFKQRRQVAEQIIQYNDCYVDQTQTQSIYIHTHVYI